VVIDASDNSLPENAKATMRKTVVVVGPMSRSVLESVPELAELLEYLMTPITHKSSHPAASSQTSVMSLTRAWKTQFPFTLHSALSD
jgi:hypothetical protein